MALIDSEVRLDFHDEIVGFLAYDHLPEDEARELMIECFQFDFAMIGAQYVASGDEGYYSGLYDYTFMMLDTLYEQTDHYVDMITYIDSWGDTVKAVRFHPSIDVTVLSRKGFVYMSIEEYANALPLFSEASLNSGKALAYSSIDIYTKPLRERTVTSIDGWNLTALTVSPQLSI